MIMDAGLNHPMSVGDVHANSGDIDSLLSSDPTDHVGGGGNGGNGGDPDTKARRLLEPYERHRAHDLRAECYRRGIRPIKKGPNANDNKNGYILLLRKYDGTGGLNGMGDDRHHGLGSASGGSGGGGGTHESAEDDGDDNDSDSTHGGAGPLAKKRKLPSQQQQQQQQHQQQTGLVAAASDLAGFYDATQPSLVPVLPMQYPNLVKPPNPTTDLEILSGIANTYTTQAGGASVGVDGAAFCGNCRTVVTDQLMESIRLGRNKMQILEYQKLMDQRDRDTLHLKEVVTVLRNLRQSLRDAQTENRLTHELLVELEDDIAFFQTLKERTKERMRKEMQDARDRAAKQGSGGGVGAS